MDRKGVTASPQVIVTGASGGIGSAVCLALVEAGLEPVGVDETPSRWTGGVAHDLREPTIIESLKRIHGLSRLTGIVHCAAIQPLGDLGSHPNRTWQESFWINLWSIDWLTSTLLPELQATSGSVVAISSVHARLSRNGAGLYAITKAGLDAWVRAASIDYAPVRVNGISPGAIASQKLQESLEDSGAAAGEYMDRLTRRTPLGRVGSPRDVADLALFLLGSKASFLSGQNITLDGGVSALLATEVE